VTHEISRSSQRVGRALIFIALLGGCTPQGVLFGAGALLGRTVLQERSSGDALKDVDIELSVMTRVLEMSPRTAAGVVITSVEGRVLLTGDVESAERAAQVVSLVWLSSGVRAVANEMSVNSSGGMGGAASDLALAASIRLRLLRDPGIADINFTILADGGTVHLAGLARDAEELRKLVWHARRVAGVVRVVSHVLFLDDPRRLEERDRPV
jgi:osmotically-inducible protein OsmY